jgi:hypothetical protein
LRANNKFKEAGMFKFITVVVMFLLTIFLLNDPGMAQAKYPRVSPLAKTTQTVGITDMTVTYSRPGVKGRVIWGELVPYDEVWRTGANEATTFEVSTEVTVAAVKIPAGKYSLFTIPSREEWTVVINKNPNTWGANNYKAEEDVVRFKVKPEPAEHQEWMIFTFDNLTKSSIDLVLRWEKVRISIPIAVNTDDLVINAAKNELGWQPASRAASYCLENNVSLEEGKKWIDRSLAVEKNYWNLTLKARYWAFDKKYKEAIKTMQEALDLAQKMAENQKPWNLADMEKLQSEWKQMK